MALISDLRNLNILDDRLQAKKLTCATTEIIKGNLDIVEGSYY